MHNRSLRSEIPTYESNLPQIMIDLSSAVARRAARWAYRGCLLLAVGLPLSGCGASGDNATAPSYKANNSFVQKGPYIRFSTVTVDELDQTLNPAGSTYTYQTNTDIGTFSPIDDFHSPYLSLTASGGYFDEIANAVSTDPLTLREYADLSSNTSVNINILTTLAYQRIKTLVSQSQMDFSAARAQAAKEVLAAFHIRNIPFIDFSGLNISRSGDNDSILMAISSIFLQAATTRAPADSLTTTGELTKLIDSFATDLADNGVIDDGSGTLLPALAEASQTVDLTTLAKNLTNMYRKIVSLPTPISADNIVKWIDRDGDGVIEKYSLSQTNAQAGTDYTSANYIVAAGDDSTTASLYVPDPSTLAVMKINGTQYPASGKTVHTGDKITLTLTAGAQPMDAVSAYLKLNSTPVEKYTVVTAPIAVTNVTAMTSVGEPSDHAISPHSKTLFLASMPSTSAGSILRNDGGLYVYDVTNVTNSLSPNRILLEQDADSGLYAGYYGVALSDTSVSSPYTVYVADSQQKMREFTIDTTTPGVTVGATTAITNLATSIVQAASGLSKVFLGTAGYNVHGIDVTVSPPTVSDTENITLQPRGLTISPDYTQLIAYSGVQAKVDELDIDSTGALTPGATDIANANLLPTGVLAAAYFANKQILAVGASGTELRFATVDLTVPTAPAKRGEGVAAIPAYDGTGIGVSYSQDTNMAYVVVMGKLFLIDVSDPVHPIVRGSLVFPNTVASSKLSLPPKVVASPDGASVYAIWNRAVFSLHIGP
jgi:hypothetical protein